MVEGSLLADASGVKIVGKQNQTNFDPGRAIDSQRRHGNKAASPSMTGIPVTWRKRSRREVIERVVLSKEEQSTEIPHIQLDYEKVVTPVLSSIYESTVKQTCIHATTTNKLASAQQCVMKLCIDRCMSCDLRLAVDRSTWTCCVPSLMDLAKSLFQP